MLPVRVSIRSDDRILCDGLRRILAADDALVFVDLDDSQLLAANPIAGNAPYDVLMLDARSDDALRLCARFAERDGHAPIIFIEVEEGEAAATDALAAGARGILQRSARPEDVAMAIHTVAKGQVWAPRHIIVTAWLRAIKREPAKGTIPPSLSAARLTAREMEVLHCAAAGLANREVASKLAISEATVKVHLTRVFQKLGLRGRAKLAAVYHDIQRPL